jgi:hypothetical protein
MMQVGRGDGGLGIVESEIMSDPILTHELVSMYI